jgi:hypothetical protein
VLGLALSVKSPDQAVGPLLVERQIAVQDVTANVPPLLGSRVQLQVVEIKGRCGDFSLHEIE